MLLPLLLALLGAPGLAASSPPTRAARVVSADGVAYTVHWRAPARNVEGTNRLVFDLRRETSGGTAPLRGARLSIRPWMWMGPGDGHPTPSEPPREVSPGRWVVPVYYVMPGEWEMTVVIARPGVAPDTVRFAPFTVYPS